MICIRRKKCEKIINSLIQEYHSRYRQEANQRIAEVAQDHISRGFANSTVVVTKKLAVEYNYIDKLADFLFQSLEKDFPKFPLTACKEILIRSVEVEYKKLPPTANNWLMQANLLQSGMIDQYEKNILGKLEQAKKNIENRCEISTEKQIQHKWWKDPKFIITTIIAIIGIIGIRQCSNSTIRENTNIEPQTSGDYSPITTGPNSPINVTYESTFSEDKLRSALKRAMEDIYINKNAQYEKDFPLGYVLFSITPEKEIVVYEKAPNKLNLQIDWRSSRIVSENEKEIVFTWPNFIDAGGNEFQGNVAVLQKSINSSFKILGNGYEIEAKIIDINAGNTICIMGFR